MKKEFKSCSLNDMVRDWVACISTPSRIDWTIEPRWILPNVGKYKINFDGASFANPRPAAFGCVMRDS